MNLTILRAMLNGSRFALGALVLSFGLVTQVLNAQMLQLNELDYYEKPGVNALVFSNWYNDNFSDSKISGVELIHHGVRTATNGDVRLLPTPEQCLHSRRDCSRCLDFESGFSGEQGGLALLVGGE